MEKNWKKIYMCNWNHFTIHLKLTQYCKSTIFQFKKILPDRKCTSEGEKKDSALLCNAQWIQPTWPPPTPFPDTAIYVFCSFLLPISPSSLFPTSAISLIYKRSQVTTVFVMRILSFALNSNLRQFSSVQSLTRVRLFATPWIAARQASLSITNSRSLFKLMPIESVMHVQGLIKILYRKFPEQWDHDIGTLS